LLLITNAIVAELINNGMERKQPIMIRNRQLIIPAAEACFLREIFIYKLKKNINK
jgi:hypothetical protein